MAMYNPSGSGNVHLDKSISGRKAVAAKKMPMKMTGKKMPPDDMPMTPKKAAKKAAKKQGGYK